VCACRLFLMQGDEPYTRATMRFRRSVKRRVPKEEVRPGTRPEDPRHRRERSADVRAIQQRGACAGAERTHIVRTY
jgi:hypothetical protein